MYLVGFSVFCLWSTLWSSGQVSGQQKRPRYEPTWASLDTRPIPSWYDEVKIGIFFHWGVFSVPGFGSEWFWRFWKNGDANYVNFIKDNYVPSWTYADFAKEFTVQKHIFDPSHWAEVFNASGAGYIVQTTKHHEGFCNWPTNVSFNWNSMAVGPKRDLVGEVAQAVRAYPNLRYGIYHSLYEWFHPLYLMDKASGYKTQRFVSEKTMPELYELINTYKPELIWSDGQWEAPSSYWNSSEFVAWLYNDSPVRDSIVVNDRWGNDTLCKHGDYFTCHDRFNPGVLQKKKFENAMTLDKYSWGFRRKTKLVDVLTIEELIATLARTVSCNGNLLINFGPTKDGVMDMLFEERLRQLGKWLQVNGDAIYKTRPWTYQNDTNNATVWYTSRTVGAERAVYAIVLYWPEDTLELASPIPSAMTTVSLLGVDGFLDFDHMPGTQGMTIHVPVLSYNRMPCHWAWVFKMTSIVN